MEIKIQNTEICTVCGGEYGLHNHMNKACPKDINASMEHTEYRDTVFSLAVSLESLPPGTLFKYNGTIALKSEYRSDGGTINAYIVGSGEMFWGGTSNPKDLAELRVIPLCIKSNTNKN
jgi:hypothetical protein